jgi:hypothetical protein
MMEGWVQKGIVAQLLLFQKEFNKLTWRPQYYDGQVPPINTETRRGANFSKQDPGYVPWWAHNGLQIHDNDWDLNISYYNNQLDIVVQYAPMTYHTSVQPALTQSVASASINMQATTNVMQHSTTVTIDIGTSPAATMLQTRSAPATTSSQRYTGTGRPTYSRIVTSDRRVRRSKQGASLPPRRQMQFMASRMCCPGDENLVKVEHEENNSDDGEGTTAVTSVSVIKSTSETDTM